jgi:dihydropteroate synthase
MQWVCQNRVFSFKDRPLVMGILNVTPDSFSDGGCHAGLEGALEHGRRMLDEGADLLDVGGESTRPGAQEVPEAEELRRVIPVVEALARDPRAAISVDTCKAAVAREALRAGACIINDVTALTGDPAMADVARESGAGVVLMHMQGTPRTMQAAPAYRDVLAEIGGYLRGRVRALTLQQGLREDCLVVDPGLGFGKTPEHNLRLLAGLPALQRDCGRPVLAGLSRKSFLGGITGRDVHHRMAASLAGLVYSVLRGACILRVHDVRESVDAVKVAVALRNAEAEVLSHVE